MTVDMWFALFGFAVVAGWLAHLTNKVEETHSRVTQILRRLEAQDPPYED